MPINQENKKQQNQSRYAIMNSRLKTTANALYRKWILLRRKVFSYGPLEVFGPEHEFSLVDDQMKPLPISDKVIKDYHGKIVDFVETPKFAFGKEQALHQIEIRAKKPFKSPETFEETMQNAVSTLLEFLRRKHQAQLLGTGMHPLLSLEETSIWPHSNQETVQEYAKMFNLKCHGWRNIQSFQVNLPYLNEKQGVTIFNALTHLCAYLPAIAASSPFCEGKLTPYVDSRLYNYKDNMKETPSIAGDVVPEYISSFEQYRREGFGKYSKDLAKAGAGEILTNAEWLNQRGIIFKFSREAIEVRIMDEQECIKSDVALSCFTRATVRGLIAENTEFPQHQLLVNDYNAIIRNGLQAQTQHPQGKTAKEVCQYFFNIASKHADANEKKYLWIIKKRIEEGNLSEIIRKRVEIKAQKTTSKEAIVSIYQQLAKALSENQPYF